MYELALGAHTFTVKASDLAGNTSAKSVDFEVKTSNAALEELVQRFAEAGWIDNQGIANSMLKKLQNQNVSSFIHEVNAQKGKHVSADAAEYLLRDAESLLHE